MLSNPGPDVAIIVVAAGSGTRLGGAVPKAFAEVAGRAILSHALESIFAIAEALQVVVVAPADWMSVARDLSVEVAGVAEGYLSVVAGGDTRQESVAAGLAALDPDVRVVLVHDAARAFTPVAVFESVIEGVRTTRAGIVPSLPVSDTIKRVDGGKVVSTVDRSQLVAGQTPQGFPRVELERSYLDALEDFTDDAALYSAAGHPVSVIAGDALAFKITTPWDLRRAESLLPKPLPEFRTGLGIDVHAFDDMSPLWLAGIFWPDERGLSGHSDGDAVSHAICDSLLSASGFGDIGSRFGTADPRFSNAHGEVFLTATVAMLAAAGMRVVNVSVQVVATHPKIGSRRAEIESRLSEIVGAPVSVAGTTSDGLGFTGNGEGVAVIATCLVQLNR